MKKLFMIPLLFVMVPGYALADDAEPLLPVDNRIKILTYDESDVYTIRTKYGYQTNIVFSQAEDIQTISVGDRSTWQLIPAGHRLFIRPMAEGVTTNMTVLTNKHSYQFDLVSLAPPSKKKEKGEKEREDNIYVARFLYPDEHRHVEPTVPDPHSMAAVAAAPAPAPVMSEPAPAPAPMAAPPPAEPTPLVEKPAAAAPRPSGLNYNYTYSGPDEQAPLQVYDDGKSTHIKYRQTGQLPNISIMENGEERPTTYYVKDDTMVVDTVTAELVLKTTGGDVHVYNETLNAR